MKIVHSGNIFQVYDDDLKTYNQLPVGVYTLHCSQQMGWYMKSRDELEVKEKKIYGNHQIKVEKVLRTYDEFNRNLGIILSGNKGIGKSLFTRLLAIEANKKGLPVLMIEKYIPGLAAYIQNIDQEIMVMFDEYDKTFGGVKAPDGAADPQTELLSLFDGTSTGKKLFVITCNETNKISSYLVNRPGRFHYHFRFENPDSSEVREYLQDNITDKDNWKYIDAIVSFASRVGLNYDCLRSITFEINQGESFEEAIKDLNIVNAEIPRYQISIVYKDGTIAHHRYSTQIDLFTNKDVHIDDFYIGSNYIISDIYFNTSDVEYDLKEFTNKVDGSRVTIDYTEYDEEDKERAKHFKQIGVDFVRLDRERDKSFHYNLL